MHTREILILLAFFNHFGFRFLIFDIPPFLTWTCISRWTRRKYMKHIFLPFWSFCLKIIYIWIPPGSVRQGRLLLPTVLLFWNHRSHADLHTEMLDTIRIFTENVRYHADLHEKDHSKYQKSYARHGTYTCHTTYTRAPYDIHTP